MELFLHKPLEHYGVGSVYTELYKDGIAWVKKATFVDLTQEMVLISRLDNVEDVLTLEYLEGDVIQRLTDKVEDNTNFVPVGSFVGNLYGVGTIDGVDYYVCSSEYLSFLTA